MPGEKRGRLAGLDPVVRDALVPHLHRDAQLHAREVRAEAAVRAGAEGDVDVALALEVDALRVVEVLVVGVGGAEQQRRQLAFA